MEQNRIVYLHNQYINKSLTSGELKEWKDALSDIRYERLLKDLMQETWHELKETTLEDMPKHRAESLFQQITVLPQPKPRHTLWWPRIAVAASIALVVMIGIYLYQQAKVVKQTTETAYKNDVAPGRNEATLILADGRKISIREAMAGSLAIQSGAKISKLADGEISYVAMPNNGKTLAYNTLETARGQQTKVRLADGTLVFLNSASSLKYPTTFAGARTVELTGEAYFEVAHNKAKPFRVLSNGQEVKVLGTHFNVNSYPDEPTMKTTLLQGSVLISSTKGERQSLVIRPGEQAALSQLGMLTVEEVTANDVIAWTNGKFIFEGESIADIMKTISRWYDVEITYQGDVKSRRFAGTLSRKDNISKILDKIAFTQAAHFKIEGRRITVMP